MQPVELAGMHRQVAAELLRGWSTRPAPASSTRSAASFGLRSRGGTSSSRTAAAVTRCSKSVREKLYR